MKAFTASRVDGVSSDRIFSMASGKTIKSLPSVITKASV